MFILVLTVVNAFIWNKVHSPCLWMINAGILIQLNITLRKDKFPFLKMDSDKNAADTGVSLSVPEENLKLCRPKMWRLQPSWAAARIKMIRSCVCTLPLVLSKKFPQLQQFYRIDANSVLCCQRKTDFFDRFAKIREWYILFLSFPRLSKLYYKVNKYWRLQLFWIN